MRLADKLWNWGHLEGSHNKPYGMNCSMTPEGFAGEYGIRKAFIVSYGGNIQPPFGDLARRLSGLDEIVWSVLGDASTPLPEAELGNAEDIIAALNDGKNIIGGVVDDFFSPERMKRFPPEVLKKIRAVLNEKGLDFWCVLYDMQLDRELDEYLECFDGVTFWIWKSEELARMEEHVQKAMSLAQGKRLMLGVYLYDYAAGGKKLDPERFEKQVAWYFSLLKERKIEGVIFCSGAIGDADIETNRILKRYISEQGDAEI